MTDSRSDPSELAQLGKIVSPISDMSFIQPVIGDATVVGMGEISHGISEIFQMKNQLFEYLVKQMGFSIFSIEAGMPEAQRLNEYVSNGKGDARELIKGLQFWTWDNQDIFDLVEWMRKHNQTAEKKIQFTGFDAQDIKLPVEILKRNFADESISQTLDTVVTLLAAINDEYYANCNFTQPELDVIGPRVVQDPRYLEAQNHIAVLETFLKEHPAISEYERTQQYLKLLKSKCKGLSYNPLAERDRMMKENVLWLLKQTPGEKIMLWAHNAHVQKDRAQDWHSEMGEHLANELQDKYRAVGFVVHGGTYAAKDWEDNYHLKRDLVLSTPPADSIEAKLHALAASKDAGGSEVNPMLFVNLQNPERPEWLDKPTNSRSRGLGSVREYPVYSFGESVLTKSFDGLIYIQNTHAAQPIKAPDKKDELESSAHRFYQPAGEAEAKTESKPQVSNPSSLKKS